MINVKENDLASFFEVPFKIFEQNNFYVSPFKGDLKRFLSVENPLFKDRSDFEFFTAFKNNEPAGRIVVHSHPQSNKKYNSNIAYFGFFECINDDALAAELFKSAEEWARKKGFSEISGNFNLTAMQSMGIMTSGFEHRPYADQVYSQTYYSSLLEKNGYIKSFPMSTFEIDLLKIDVDALLREKQKALLNNPDWEFKKISASLFKKEMPQILNILNRGFANNPLFVPLTLEEFQFQAKDLALFIDDHISYMAYYKGIPVTASLHIPDFTPFLKATKSRFRWNTLIKLLQHKRKRDRALLIFSSVLPEFQNTGIMSVISYLGIKSMRERGYKTIGITWISDENAGSLKIMQMLQGKQLHRLFLYSKSLK
jgi:hypothetical protein